jgi:hypothetical protein
MTTTTQITNIADRLDISAYAGDFVDDYDMDAVHADFVVRLNENLPDGVFLANNGDVYAEVGDAAEKASEIDWKEFVDETPSEDLFERHDRVAKLLTAVTETTAAVETAERARVAAVRAAKNSGRFTVEEIAGAAKITRDGVYKMLARAEG